MSNAAAPSRIYFFPDPYPDTDWGRTGNPHPRILFEGLSSALPQTRIKGANLKKLRSRGFLRGLSREDVCIVNWPEGLLEGISHKIIKRLQRLSALTNLLSKFEEALGEKWLARWCRAVSKCEARFVIFVHELRSHNPDLAKLKLDYRIRQSLIDRADAIVLTEETTKAEVEEAFGVLETPVYYSPLGDFSIVHGPAVDKTLAREQLLLPPTTVILLLLGSRRSSRQTAPLISLVQKNPAQTLVIAGPGHEQEGQTPCEGQIIWKGFVTEREVALLVSAADWVINHGEQYLNSGVIRLSISYATPVIAYSYGSAKSVGAGCMVDLHQFKDLQEALESLPEPSSQEYGVLAKNCEDSNKLRSWDQGIAGLLDAVRGSKSSLRVS